MDRRSFLKSAAAAAATLGFPLPVMGMGEDDRFTIAQLEYGGSGWNPRPTAVRRLLLEIDKRTSVKVDPTPPSLKGDDEEIFEHPFLLMGGDRKFDPLPDETILNLRTYLQSGGFLFIDSSEGVRDGPFIEAARREIGRILPNKQIARVPGDQVLYKSFFLIDDPVGRLVVNKRMEGVFDGDRLAVVISHNDLMGAWARDNFGNWKYDCRPGGERQREMAFRLGINLAMYALCINYKADQVHVPFILKRRKWKVE